MALLWRTSTFSVPGVQLRTRRSIYLTFGLVSLIALSGFLALHFLDHLHNAICAQPSLLASSSLCSSVQRGAGRDWLIHHQGGNGPWIRKLGLYYYDVPLPKRCSADQVHMLSRHAERYPTRNAGNRHLDLLERLRSPETQLGGSLSFVADWSYFTNTSNPAFENLTAVGPYAGTRQACNTGRALRQRYSHLTSQRRPTKFWSCGSERDIETAEWFADGFFGPDWQTDGSAVLEVIPETADRGANTLTPGDTCFNYATDPAEGHDKGYIKLAEWQETFGRPIAERIKTNASGMKFSPLDIYSMMEMCGFEILARGDSPWCDVFTRQEWLEFEYARDLLHYYRAGPGNKFGPLMGWLWLNATQSLMADHSSEDAYFSFVHDGDIIPVLSTLGIFNEPLGREELPANQLAAERKWRTSDLVPMGGRIIFERITCETQTQSPETQHGVRFFVNDALIDLSTVPNTAGFPDVEGAVSLSSFQTMLAIKGIELGDFRQICGLGEDAPDRIGFLYQLRGG